MKFLVEILNGSSFEIEVDYRDTLLEVKQKIERSQRIPVSKQTLIVDDIVILREDLNVKQCQIVHNSHIQLDVSADDDNPNHNDDDQMPQTEQSPAPLLSAEEYFVGQEWPLTEEEIRKIYSYRPETTYGIRNVQDSPVMVRGEKNVSTSMKVESNNNNDQVQYPPSLLNIRFGNLRR